MINYCCSLSDSSAADRGQRGEGAGVGAQVLALSYLSTTG